MGVDQGINGRVIEGVADEGVGNAVLQRAQVDVGERRLGHGRDDAGDAGQVVGQRLVDHDIAGIGTFILPHDAQVSVPRSPVEGKEVDIGKDVRFKYHIDP